MSELSDLLTDPNSPGELRASAARLALYPQLVLTLDRLVIRLNHDLARKPPPNSHEFVCTVDCLRCRTERLLSTARDLL